MSESLLIKPYGNELINLIVPDHARAELQHYAGQLPSIQISERSTCDLEMLACGAFSPLDRFVGREDYRSILEGMRLANGYIFPVPISLPLNSTAELHLDREIALRSGRNEILAILTIDEIYDWNKSGAAAGIFGTTDPKHPLVAEMERWGKLNVSGRLQVLQMPCYYSFKELRLTPSEVRGRLESLGRTNVVAFQTRNPLHCAHEEMTKRAIAQVNGTLLLHPSVGMTKPGDIDHYTRVRSYKIVTERYYDPHRIVLALLPLAMRLAGPREALWHAVIRRNYGANHLIVGRDHASPGTNSKGEPFYDPYAAQQLVQQFSEELGVTAIPFQEMAYFPNAGYKETAAAAVESGRTISGTQLRADYLQTGRELPEWFSRPEIARLLAEAYPPRHQQGFCVWFTGLSGAGKSTSAEILTELLLEHGRRVTLLDGDTVRTNLSRGLGFSKEDRDTNIRRIGFVAAEIVRHGGVAVCAAVSPYSATRNDVRNMVGGDRFIEIFVDTPLSVCEQRDAKGIYAQARRGEIRNFTGIDDPYERPDNSEIVLETEASSAEENGARIISYLAERGFVRVASDKPDVAVSNPAGAEP
jgi:sulfate adenylyltransferase